MDNNKFGNFIIQLRKEKGLTQQQLAEKLYITDKAVSKWERGLSFPDITLLKSLADVLEVNISELINCEKGNEEDIDIQKEIDQAVKNIEKIRKEKNKKRILIISISTILIIFIGYLSLKYYNKFHPKTIVDGENIYTIGNYNLSKNGLDKMIEIIEKSENMNQKYSISYFEALLDSLGNVKTFTLSLNTFDNNEKYLGRVGYTYSNNKLYYTSPTNDNLNIVNYYDKNSSIEYISNIIKQIPITKQFKLSKFKNNFIIYKPNTIIPNGTPIYDMRTGIKEPLNEEDYKNGKGGISDGNTNVVIKLSNSSDTSATSQYQYVFNTIDSSVPNNPNNMMETDYYISNGTLKFTRDYGNTWINTDITKEQLDSTLEFYNNSLSLAANSWFISEDKYLPIAYFYGSIPTLKISLDNGKTWNETTLASPREFGNRITRRIVGFTSKNVGYVALGTDWSMNFGENKKMYLTNDFGKTWKKIDLPLNNTSATLVDLCMYDEKIGVLILENNVDVNFPLIYSTNDGGQTWEEVQFSYFNLPDEIKYLEDIDSITKENEDYIITLGQGEDGTLKAIFKTRNLFSPWLFIETTKKNIHTVG